MKREPDTPQGTIALLAVYALIIVFLWLNVYLTMLQRNSTAPAGSISDPPQEYRYANV